MIDTVVTKQQQLASGYFSVGSGPESILLIGSCRSVPYLNYLTRFGDRFTTRFIDPFNWHWKEDGSWTNFEENINAQESDPRILDALKSTNIFIHEHYANYGMFNSAKGSAKNIYQFGLNPRLDITIPNFNDVNVIGHPKEVGLANLEKFYGICRQTDFPEMESYFRDNWQTKRFFWKANHVSKEFTLFIFSLMNAKFLHLPLDGNFWNAVGQEDLFANTKDTATAEDIANYDLRWNH